SIEKLLEFNCEDKEIQREVAKTVLVIDDSPVNVTLIEVMLEKFNYKLITGENGKEAFELYLEHSPDIILMDLQMPEVDGYQATENIRKHELENEVDFPVPILAISAYALENEIAKAFQAGCTEYLCKPIKKKQLYPLIDELLKK
ncbi:MAG: response regulator, partial [Bacteriovoracaceae bacterium]|nr:response regulator [Bacteriovoracaceae bacterium]